ncbi:NAD(FAD)-dependent dehydrogenase [Halobacteroides halobius DSM 5150]|uniref:NAD(FAD)-dependent dehydrogenase n=1 Tax=Halobacteroides halobius (strain ATCC 35273 / DSM 5150 / MD-1) TaxID=748449 RepID=L0K9M9_HALHC|nr:FAD-dependent oxidoreductase [Halobacteroides halobius]AGB41245.1 NAD(FAD)-dependent dehydrogenase [Halobacteroides halobius DSM 5150]
MKIIVIGGVAAGTSTAAKAQRELPKAEITIFEQDSDISYSGCGLPYYISDLIEKREDVIVYTPERFEARKGPRVEAQHTVKKIIPDKKQVIVKNVLQNTEKKITYDKLVIATGAKPIVPRLAGVDLDNIFTLRNVNSADRIKEFITANKPQKAVIIGGGYIGLEMAESLLEYELDITVVEMADQLLTNFDRDMAEIIEENLTSKGIKIITNDGASEFKGEQKVNTVVTQSGQEIETDFVLLAIGVEPNVKLAKDANIELGSTGAIKVNKQMETSISDIYAAGDCVENNHLITNNPVWIPLGSTANKQGRVAGNSLAEVEDSFDGILGTAITKICNLAVARTGLTAREAKKEGYQIVTSTIKAGNHAGYYPGYKKINIKLIVDEITGKILGAQIIGETGVDKRIDVLATAIYNEMKADELIDLDLAYAPPFSVPKDGIMIAGLIANKKRE